jgi:hypothetical protein
MPISYGPQWAHIWTLELRQELELGISFLSICRVEEFPYEEGVGAVQGVFRAVHRTLVALLGTSYDQDHSILHRAHLCV